MRIQFNKPYVTGKEIEYIKLVFESGHTSGDGEFTKKCQSFLEKATDTKKVFLTTSCTDALEMSALLLEIEPGEEVIAPAFTFVSTANAFVSHGARPVFADIRKDTLNIDEDQIESLITDRTKAIAVVHYAGVGCEMEKILDIANRHGISVVEDNAHGLFGKFNGKHLGTFGDIAAHSFHETKNLSCGEGGALFINNPQLIERAEIIREKGTDRSRFFRGLVDKYTWVDVGSSFLPSDILAACLYAQLEQAEEIQRKREEIWNYYFERLNGWIQEHDVSVPYIPSTCEQSFHMFYLILKDLENRTSFMKFLKQREIDSVFHYLPLNYSRMGLHFGGKAGDCPVTESISDRLVRLPFHNSLTEGELSTVVSAIKEFFVGKQVHQRFKGSAV